MQMESIGNKDTKPNMHKEVQRNSSIYLQICFPLLHYLFHDISNEYMHMINGNLQICNNSGNKSCHIINSHFKLISSR